MHLLPSGVIDTAVDFSIEPRRVIANNPEELIQMD